MKIPRVASHPTQVQDHDRRIKAVEHPGTLDRGQVVLVAGSATVTCPVANTSTLVLVSYVAVSGTAGYLTAFAVTPGSILIQSNTSVGGLNTADVSTVAWMAI